MGVVKVETVDLTNSSGGTYTLSNTLSSTSSAFLRNNNTRSMSAGPIGNTSNAGPDELALTAYISSTTQLTLVNSNSINQRYIGEVWRYTGSASGSDEFIARGRYTVTLGTNVENNSVDVSSVISDRNKCICFISGKDTALASNATDWAEVMAIAYIDENDYLQVSRQDTDGGPIDVYVTVVEFTGISWTVGYCRTSFADGNSYLYDDSRGNAGNILDISNWNNTMIIEAQLEGDSGSNVAIEDRSYTAYPGSGTTQVGMSVDPTAANNGDAFIYVLSHPYMNVARQTASKSIPNNNTYDTSLTFPTITLSDLTEAALEFTLFSDGTGTAHARGAVSAYLSGTSQISTWAHRSGNNGEYAYGAVDLSSIDGTIPLFVISVDSDNVITTSQTNVVIVGTNFKSTQGTGKVELVQNSDYTGTIVEQTSIDSWSDTSIQFDVSAGTLADSYCYLFVTNSESGINSVSVQVGIPPETYSDVVTNLTGGMPDHWWKLQDNYNDDGSSTDNRPMNASVVGTHEFDTSPVLVRGETYALRFDSNTDSRRIQDVNDMNLSTQQARSFGGWVSFGGNQKSINCFYNEGGAVNNAAFIMGVGNKLLAQFADTGDDNVHVYSDFALNTDRPYFILWAFDYNGDDEFKFWIDGIKQSNYNGNPLTAADFDSHSGDVVFGKPETNLEVFGTDIAFDGNEDMHSAHWFSYTRELLQTEITELFQKGAPPKYTINTDSEANMQTALDALADTEIPDYPIGILISNATGSVSFELTFDNITFDPGCTVEIQYMSVATLTIIKENGTVIDSSKVTAPYGGTINIINAPDVTFTCKNADTKAVIEGVRVLVLADSGGDLPYQDSVTITRVSTTATVSHTAHGLRTGQEVLIKGANQEEYNGIKTITVTGANAYTFTVSGTPTTPATGTITCTSVILEETSNASGVVTANHRYTSNQPITARARSHSGTTKYQQGNLSATITSSGFSGNILMVEDE